MFLLREIEYFSAVCLFNALHRLPLTTNPASFCLLSNWLDGLRSGKLNCPDKDEQWL